MLPLAYITAKPGMREAVLREFRAHAGFSIWPIQVKRIQTVWRHGIDCPAGSRFSPESTHRSFHHGIRRMKWNNL